MVDGISKHPLGETHEQDEKYVEVYGLGTVICDFSLAPWLTFTESWFMLPPCYLLFRKEKFE